jgi:hypothetical protein
VIVEPNYRGHRIEVNAVADGDRWNADVMVRRPLSSEKPLHERVSCYKLSASHAEQAGMLRERVVYPENIFRHFSQVSVI